MSEYTTQPDPGPEADTQTDLDEQADRLDAAADEVERLLAAGEPIDPAALAARFGVDAAAVAGQAAAVRALGPGLFSARADGARRAPGTAVGRYAVLEELGRGGMGVVYRARDAELGRDVALKLLTIDDERRRKRFEREMRALARLEHRHIVPVWDNGLDGESPYLVMPVVAGTPLSELLKRRGPLAPREAAALTRDLARAVAHAHTRGVLHRDIKPDNVLITDEDARAVLTDFGLAKDLGALDARSLSVDGQAMGTPGFWAPEQACGELDLVGAATDVYGLGATLYACLTGLPPIRSAGGRLEQLRAVVAQPPEPPSRLAAVDPALESICLACLEKEPGDRPPSAEALADELDDYLRPPGSAPGRGPALAVGLGALALLAAGASALVVTARAPAPPPPSAAAAETPAATPTSSGGGLSKRDLELSDQVNRAIDLAHRGLHTQALEAAERLVEEHAEHHLAWAARGRVHFFRGDLTRAQSDLERALELEARSPLALETRGQLKERQGDLRGARTDLEAAVKLKPGWPEAWVSLGIVRGRLQEFDAALRAFDEALGLVPDHRNALSNRGFLYLRLGDARALGSFARALDQYSPGNPHGERIAVTLRKFLPAVIRERDAKPVGSPAWRRFDRAIRRGTAALRQYEGRGARRTPGDG